MRLLHRLAQSAQAISYAMPVEGRRRSYRLWWPDDLKRDEPIPLLIALHGGSSNGLAMERLTGFSLLAKRENFLVAYPDALEGHWNDGRPVLSSQAYRANVDDVGFINTLINVLGRETTLDMTRIFVTGISNGGMFAHVLAGQLANRVAAIAPVVGGIVENTVAQFHPRQPVSVLIMQGTADPVVPFAGGAVRPGERGRVIPTEQAVALWVQKNGCEPNAVVETLPTNGAKDGCQVTVSRWSGGRNSTEVVYYKIEGGGHTWPGGLQYLPKFMIGPVCRQFDVTETIWKFFATHPKAI